MLNKQGGKQAANMSAVNMQHCIPDTFAGKYVSIMC